MAKQVSDYEINGAVRRELCARGLDLVDIKYRTHGGAVEVSGKLKFKEPKSPHQVIKELFLLETAITGIRGVKRVKMDFEEFEKKSGKWGVSDERQQAQVDEEPRREEEPRSN